MESQLSNWKQGLAGLMVEMVFLKGKYSRPYFFNFHSYETRKFHASTQQQRVYKHLEGNLKPTLSIANMKSKDIDYNLAELFHLLNCTPDVIGLMGLGEGGCVVDLFLRLLNAGSLRSQLFSKGAEEWLAIIIAGYSLAPTAGGVRNPSLHIIATGDEGRALESYVLSMPYSKPIIIECGTPQGNVPPMNFEIENAIKSILQRAHSKKLNNIHNQRL